MATKSIAWEAGSGYISLEYTGQGNGSISITSDANDSYDDRQQIVKIATSAGSPSQAVDLLIKQKGKTLPVGTVYNYSYTGTVQSVTLPAGQYKLQCWGAQGGTSSEGNAAGSKGGYSEGVLTLTKITTLYIFVGGKGASSGNGGWNCGGGASGSTSYNSGGTYGYSKYACGGGATDICTVTSSMTYSSYINNRSDASLLSRCIVAGGGSGGSYRHTETTSTQTYTATLSSVHKTYDYGFEVDTYYNYPSGYDSSCSYTIKKKHPSITYNGKTYAVKTTVVLQNNLVLVVAQVTDQSIWNSLPTGTLSYSNISVQLTRTETTTSTSSGKSSGAQVGGGASGGGQYPGTQKSAGAGGAFGKGQSVTVTNYRYSGGAGGGGWYGGGSAYSDSSTDYVNHSGGGSGFVNTAANAGSRPSGYTGLQLDSGTTTAGNASFESTSGGTEKGHSGNGYARITKLA